MATTTYLPKYVPPPPPPYKDPLVNIIDVRDMLAAVPARSQVNAIASDPQLQIAAENAPLRITYGRNRIGAQIAAVLPHNGYWVIHAVWGEGEIDAVEELQLDNATPPDSAVITHYTGTLGQTVNATMVAAFAAQTPPRTYADALPGVAYSVIKVYSGLLDSMPQITAVIRGLKVYDPRTTLTAYSANPALALADLISNTTYGMGRTVTWSSVTDTANACDAVIGTGVRRTIGVTLDAPNAMTSVLEAMRLYAGCFVVDDGAGLRLVLDRPSASVASFAHASGQILKLLRITKHGTRSQPTVIEVQYTDTSASPWRTRSVYSYADGVLSGTVPRRESQLFLPGVQSASQATREATERLNKLTLTDLTVQLQLSDEAAKLQVGDVITVTHPIGLTSKLLRVMAIDGSLGRYQVSAEEYDEQVYSDVVVGEPSSQDTTLPSPASPPVPTGLALIEEVYQLETGLYASRIAATWTDDTWPYRAAWSVVMYASDVKIAGGNSQETAWRSPAVQEGLTYEVIVKQVSIIGAYSDGASATIVSVGKLLAPGNVTGLTGFEAAGDVRLAWNAAVDLDIYRYEIRYGVTSVTWANATVLDRIDALRYSTKAIPAGTWDFLLCALDSVGQYSTTAARVAIAVTSDTDAYFVGDHAFVSPTLTNMSEYSMPASTIRYWVTEDGVAFGTKYSSVLSTYTSILAVTHTSVTSTWQSEEYDYGADYSGDWLGAASAAALSGTYTDDLQLKPAGGAYTDYAAMVAKTNARYAKIKIGAATTSTLKVTVPAITVNLNVTAREESGNGTSSASTYTRITLANSYSAVKTIVITPTGTTFASGVADNLVLGATTTFDVYVFDAAGTKIARAFYWTWKGV